MDDSNNKKILLICWDIWDFRNTLIHGKGGCTDRAKNRELCFQIRQQMTIGCSDLHANDKYLFGKKKYNIESLLNLPIDQKRNWLDAVISARESLEIDEEEDGAESQTKINTLQQTTIKNYYQNKRK